jgi:hypothetical protein
MTSFRFQALQFILGMTTRGPLAQAGGNGGFAWLPARVVLD